MLAAIVSDVHIGSIDEPHHHDFVRWLDALDAPMLYLLGDVFHWWWGSPGLVNAAFVPVLAALHRAHQRGITLRYVPGNHDFHLGPFFTETLQVEVASRFELDFAGKRLLLVHGDEADQSKGYRLTRRVLRGRPYAGLMRALGPAMAQRIGERLAGGSRELGGMAPNPKLLEAQAHWAQARIDEGFDVVILGHSHAPGVHELRGGTLINLGDFVNHRTWLALEEPLALRRWPAGA